MMEKRSTQIPDRDSRNASARTVPTPVWTGSGSTGHCAACPCQGSPSSISAPWRDPPG